MSGEKDRFMEELGKFSKNELIQACRERGIRVSTTEKKTEILERLIDSVLEGEESTAISGEEEVKVEESAIEEPQPKRAGSRLSRREAGIALRKERERNVKNVNTAIKSLDTDREAYAKATGEDAELRPRVLRNAPESLSITGERHRKITPEEEDDFDLIESLNSSTRILTGVHIMTVEDEDPWVMKTNPLTGEKQRCYQVAAVVRYGTRVVYIPAEYYLENYYSMNQANMRSYIEERAMAEIDFRVTKADRSDPKNPVYIGSRIAAMKQKRCDFWYSDRQKGKELLQIDSVHEARVVAVSKDLVFVELFGADLVVNARNVSYNWIEDMRDEYSPGDIVDVRIKSVALADKRRADALGYPVECSLSIREAKDDPRDIFFKINLKTGRFSGILRNKKLEADGITWYYAEMGSTKDQEGITIKCRVAERCNLPAIGDRVSGKITFVNDKQKIIFGTIYHVDPQRANRRRR